jgi:hypothetical protein
MRITVVVPIYQDEAIQECGAHGETFEFLHIRSKLSFLRKQESSPFNDFIDSRFRGNDKKVRFSKVSDRDRIIETVRTFKAPSEHPPLYGDGQAAEKIISTISGKGV